MFFPVNHVTGSRVWKCFYFHPAGCFVVLNALLYLAGYTKYITRYSQSILFSTIVLQCEGGKVWEFHTL